MEMITTRGDIVRETKTLYTSMLFVCFLGGLFGVQSSKVHGSCCVEKSSLGWSRLDEHVSLPPYTLAPLALALEPPSIQNTLLRPYTILPMVEQKKGSYTIESNN